jgi:hypothetical protein
MTPRTRYFVFGALAILLVGLCTGLVAYYSGLPMGAFGRTDTPAELSYVPADAAVVAYCNVQDVMRSQLRQQLQKNMPDREEGQQEFERETGLNIERDIDRVVGFLVPTDTQDRHRGMVLASGRFDAVRLEGLAREHGGEVTEYKGKRLITRAADEQTGEGVPKSMSVAFLAPGLVAVGDTDSVKLGIDNAGGANITTNTELMDLVRDIDDSNAWAVGRFDALVKHANLPEGVTSQIPAVKWFSASGHVNGGLSGLLRAEARDEQAGQNLRDVIQGFLALARLQAGNRPEIQAMVSSLQVSGSGRTVALSFSLPSEAIEALGAAAGAAKKSHEMHRERQHGADDR